MEKPSGWDNMSPAQRDKVRDWSGLTEKLLDCEGWRVEVETLYGETRRFIVGRSTGWRPCHLEVKRVNSSGGGAADRDYKSVRKLYKVRG